MDLSFGSKEGSCCVCLWNVAVYDPGTISSVCDKRSEPEPGAANMSLGSFVLQ